MRAGKNSLKIQVHVLFIQLLLIYNTNNIVLVPGEKQEEEQKKKKEPTYMELTF